MQIPSRSQRGRHVVRACGWLGAFLLLIGTLLAATARISWVGELFANVRFYLGVGGALAAGLLFVARRPRIGAATFAISLLHLLPAWNLSIGAAPAGVTGTAIVRVASLNLWMGNVEPFDTLGFVEGFEPDLFAFSEVARDWPEQLATWTERFPHRAVAPGWPYGIALLSRYPLEDVRIIEAPHQGPPWDPEATRPDCLTAKVLVDGVRLQVIVLHPQRPGRPWRTRARNFLFDAIARLEWEGPTVLMGDLNATSYSPGFTDLMRRTGLSDSRQGFGRRPSWGWPDVPFGHCLALDHVLVQGVDVLERGTGPDLGGDHLPVTAVLRLPAE